VDSHPARYEVTSPQKAGDRGAACGPLRSTLAQARIGGRSRGFAADERITTVTAQGGSALPVKLHRCSTIWLKIGPHPCWKVQKALDQQGIEYELVPGPLSRGKRDDLEKLSGQRMYPVIEFEDGTVYRANSKEMAARISAGNLFEPDAS
jgi:glutathione S-transferase-like protein